MKKLNLNNYEVGLNIKNFMLMFGVSALILMKLNIRAALICFIIFLAIGFIDTFKIIKR